MSNLDRLYKIVHTGCADWIESVRIDVMQAQAMVRMFELLPPGPRLSYQAQPIYRMLTMATGQTWKWGLT